MYATRRAPSPGVQRRCSLYPRSNLWAASAIAGPHFTLRKAGNSSDGEGSAPGIYADTVSTPTSISFWTPGRAAAIASRSAADNVDK